MGLDADRAQPVNAVSAAIMAKGQDMNEHATDLDQADEDILTYTVSDEAVEAAGTEGSPRLFPTSPIPATTISCC
jgi:hypothetical protein